MILDPMCEVGKDMGQCVLMYKNEKEKKSTDTDLWGYLKARDLKGLYPEDKIAILLSKRTQQGWYVEDDDFPEEI